MSFHHQPENVSNAIHEDARVNTPSVPQSAADSVASAFTSQLSQAQADLAEARAHILALQSELERTRSDAADAAAAAASELTGVKRNAAIHTAAIASGLIDMDCLPLLDASKIQVQKDGSVTGVDEAFSDLKQSKPYLFPAESASRRTATARSAPSPAPQAASAQDVRRVSNAEYGAALKKIAPGYQRRSR